jgi:hypothetical protein
VSFGWLFFVYPITDFLTAMGSLAGTDVSALPSLDLILMTIFAALICFFVRAERLVDALPHLNGLISSIAGISIAFLAIVILLFIDRSATFIYFRF